MVHRARAVERRAPPALRTRGRRLLILIEDTKSLGTAFEAVPTHLDSEGGAKHNGFATGRFMPVFRVSLTVGIRIVKRGYSYCTGNIRVMDTSTLE